MSESIGNVNEIKESNEGRVYSESGRLKNDSYQTKLRSAFEIAHPHSELWVISKDAKTLSLNSKIENQKK